MLSDLASAAEYPEVKKAAENCKGWRATNIRRMS